MAAVQRGRRRWRRSEGGGEANNMIFDSTGGGDWYIRIYTGGDVVYLIIHVSAQSGVHVADYI
jgi:hypothetical protein